MTKRITPTWHFEYSWKRTRVLVGAAMCGVVVWRVALLPLLGYLEDTTDWISAGLSKSNSFYNLDLDYGGLMASLIVIACLLASTQIEREHRGHTVLLAPAVILAVVLNFGFNPFSGLRFAMVSALAVVPFVFLASCVVARNMSRMRGVVLYGFLFVALWFISITFYSDKAVEYNRLEHAMYQAQYKVMFSHYYAVRAPERMYQHTVFALANAPQFRELDEWKMQLSERGMPWGRIVDGGTNEDYVDFAYRTIGNAPETPVKLYDLSEKSSENERAFDDLGVSNATLRNFWMVQAARSGIVKNAYVVTEQQIMRCLTRVVSTPKKRRGVAFVAGRPVPDIELDNEILHCFDGQVVHNFQPNSPVESVSSPCIPLHGFGNYSPDEADVLLAFIMRLWTVDEQDLKDAARHFVTHALNPEHQEQLMVQLATANKRYEQGDVAAAQAAVDDALALLQDLVMGDLFVEMNADKRAFLTSLFASYHARKNGDDALAREHDDACIAHRTRWYETDPQAALLARTAVATDSVAAVSIVGNIMLVSALGLTGELQKEIPKSWSEEGFWRWKLEHDRTLIEQASAYFGTILDSFVSTRVQQAEYEQIRKSFAKSADGAFYRLVEDGMDITRYFLGSEHNGWCRYRLVMQYGEPAEGKKTASLQSRARYCRIDDVLMSFDEDGQPARKWDAAGLPFHAPVVVGNLDRWRGLSDAQHSRRANEDERDALLGLFLDQLTVGALADVESLNLDLHPGAHSFRGEQRAAMERMRLSGEDVH